MTEEQVTRMNSALAELAEEFGLHVAVLIAVSPDGSIGGSALGHFEEPTAKKLFDDVAATVVDTLTRLPGYHRAEELN